MQRSYSFLVVLLLFFCGEIFAQQKADVILPVTGIDAIKPAIKKRPLSFIKSPRDTISCWPATYQPLYMKNKTAASVMPSLPVISLLSPISSSYYSNNLGFFCKKELQLQKLTAVPFRFRLGSLDYVNYLEQKPNALKPGH